MADTIAILTEEALQPSDADQITTLYEGQDVAFRVFVPAGSDQSLITEVLDYLLMGELREAWEAALGKEPKPSPDEARRDAAADLDASLALLRDRGAGADGEVVPGDPMPAVVNAVIDGHASQLVVVSRPHTLADTFHKDWASKAREELGVPVLHLYAGTDRIVD